MNNTFKKAFSLTETIIILTVLAVAVAASTPLITKKVINVADAGATITGAAHGRYEIFTKEIITTPDGDYEKTSTPPKRLVDCLEVVQIAILLRLDACPMKNILIF